VGKPSITYNEIQSLEDGYQGKKGKLRVLSKLITNRKDIPLQGWKRKRRSRVGGTPSQYRGALTKDAEPEKQRPYYKSPNLNKVSQERDKDELGEGEELQATKNPTKRLIGVSDR